MGIIDDDNESFLERLSEEKTRDSNAQKAIIELSGQEERLGRMAILDAIDVLYEKLVKNQERKRYADTSRLRKYSAFWVMAVVTLWLVGVFCVLKFNNSCFCLSDSVLIALLTTTTANILGLPFIILQGLYPKEKEKLKDKDKKKDKTSDDEPEPGAEG